MSDISTREILTCITAAFSIKRFEISFELSRFNDKFPVPGEDCALSSIPAGKQQDQAKKK